MIINVWNVVKVKQDLLPQNWFVSSSYISRPRQTHGKKQSISERYQHAILRLGELRHAISCNNRFYSKFGEGAHWPRNLRAITIACQRISSCIELEGGNVSAHQFSGGTNVYFQPNIHRFQNLVDFLPLSMSSCAFVKHCSWWIEL